MRYGSDALFDRGMVGDLRRSLQGWFYAVGVLIASAIVANVPRSEVNRTFRQAALITCAVALGVAAVSIVVLAWGRPARGGRLSVAAHAGTNERIIFGGSFALDLFFGVAAPVLGLGAKGWSGSGECSSATFFAPR